MPRDHAHDPDPNANPAWIVRVSTAEADDVMADLEAAWQAFSPERRPAGA